MIVDTGDLTRHDVPLSSHVFNACTPHIVRFIVCMEYFYGQLSRIVHLHYVLSSRCTESVNV